jgi:choline dehydrogenase-like flavoprotein
MKYILEFVQLSPLSELVTGRWGPIANATTDADLLAYAQTYAVSEDHGSCTARMSPYGADWGVVDPDHKVKGSKGLRVVDASTFVSVLCDSNGALLTCRKADNSQRPYAGCRLHPC